MRVSNKTDAEAINKYFNLVKRAEAFDLQVKNSDCFLSIVHKDKPFSPILNCAKDIELLEGFILGLEYMAKQEP